ncbi:MAG: DUF4070 domain-containing protein, partial [Synechococcaceae cyanobacterium]
LAADQELMDQMVECRFESVFLGIETPDAASLETARKLQNIRSSLEESVEKITASGLRVMAGFIIGFDGEKRGAGARIVEFVTRTGIPHAMMGMLQALPNTAMWTRLEQEGRLIQDSAATKGVNQTNLLNFVPTRPIKDIASEYMEAFSALYEPNAYIDRVYSYFLRLPPQRYKQILREGKHGSSDRPNDKRRTSWVDLRALAIVVWRQGIRRNSRWRFWRALLGMARQNPARFTGFISILAHNEHFLEYRGIVRREIEEQLALLPPDPPENARVRAEPALVSS